MEQQKQKKINSNGQDENVSTKQNQEKSTNEKTYNVGHLDLIEDFSQDANKNCTITHHLFHITDKGDLQKFKVPEALMVNVTIDVTMEVDSGAAVTVIHKNTFNKL